MHAVRYNILCFLSFYSIAMTHRQNTREEKHTRETTTRVKKHSMTTRSLTLLFFFLLLVQPMADTADFDVNSIIERLLEGKKKERGLH